MTSPKPPLDLIHGTGNDADVVITPEDEADAHAFTTQLSDWLIATHARDGHAIAEQVIEHVPDGGVRLDEMELLILFEIAVTALRGIASNRALNGNPEASPSDDQAWTYRNLAAVALHKILPRDRSLTVVS